MKTEATGRRARRFYALALALLSVGVCFYARAAASAQVTGWTVARRGTEGRDLNAVYFADAKRGWAAGDGGLLLRTEDGGLTWVQQQVGVRDSINDVYFRDKEDGYLLAGNRVLVTADGGRSWQESGRFAASDFGGALPELYSVRFGNKKKGWIVGSVSRNEVVVDSLVLSTSDGGATWRRQVVPSRDELIHLDFDGEKRGWIVGDRGTILRTTDGGASWVRLQPRVNTTLYHVDFRGQDDGWIVGGRGTVLRTADGGDTWTPVSVPGVRATLLSVQFVNGEEGWIVGRGGTILRSGDGGRTWVRQESGTQQNLYALFLNKKNGWAVGAGGLVMRYER